MRVLYFGNYDSNYSRNRVLIHGLRDNGVEVLECNSRRAGLAKFVELFRKHWRMRNSYDVMVVGFLGQQIIPFAKLISRKPIVFDSFLSLYDSNVFDRKTVKSDSLKARYYWLLDWLSMYLANIVLFDTEQHIKYASKEFGIKVGKFRRIWIGASDDIFYPAPKQNMGQFTILFYGSFIPLQGIEYILASAKLLNEESVRFVIIGNGQEKKKMLTLSDKLGLNDVEFKDYLEPQLLKNEIAKADVCLGIFGATHKTQRVIPNKVYECIAMQKPVITADTPAIRELFDPTDLALVESANPQALATAIIKLKDNHDLRDAIAVSGYARFKQEATPFILGGKLKQIIYELKK